MIVSVCWLPSQGEKERIQQHGPLTIIQFWSTGQRCARVEKKEWRKRFTQIFRILFSSTLVGQVGRQTASSRAGGTSDFNLPVGFAARVSSIGKLKTHLISRQKWKCTATTYETGGIRCRKRILNAGTCQSTTINIFVEHTQSSEVWSVENVQRSVTRIINALPLISFPMRQHTLLGAVHHQIEWVFTDIAGVYLLQISGSNMPWFSSTKPERKVSNEKKKVKTKKFNPPPSIAYCLQQIKLKKL